MMMWCHLNDLISQNDNDGDNDNDDDNDDVITSMILSTMIMTMMLMMTMTMTMMMMWCHLNDPVSLFDPGRICGRLGVNVSNQLTLLEIIVSHLFHDVVVVMAMSIGM